MIDVSREFLDNLHSLSETELSIAFFEYLFKEGDRVLQMVSGEQRHGDSEVLQVDRAHQTLPHILLIGPFLFFLVTLILLFGILFHVIIVFSVSLVWNVVSICLTSAFF